MQSEGGGREEGRVVALEEDEEQAKENTIETMTREEIKVEGVRAETGRTRE